MAKDENGIDPRARDGEPDSEQAAADHDLASRRALKEARERVEEEQVLGKSIDDQPEDQTEMFPLGTITGDPKVTWKTLIKAGTPVKLECALSRAAVPMLSGLHAYGDKGEVLVTFEAGSVRSVPELGDEDAAGRRKVKGVKLVQELRAVHVRAGEGMFSLEQVLDILEGEFGIPRSADKIAEVFGPQTPAQRAAAVAAG